MSGRFTGRDFGGSPLRRGELKLRSMDSMENEKRLRFAADVEIIPYWWLNWWHCDHQHISWFWPDTKIGCRTEAVLVLPPKVKYFWLGWSVDWRFPKVMEWRKYKEAIAESREAAFFFWLRVNHKFNFPVLLRLEGCNIPQGGKDALWQSSGSSAVGGCWYLYVLILGTPMWIYS